MQLIYVYWRARDHVQVGDESGRGADAARRLWTLSTVRLRRHRSLRQRPVNHAHEHYDIHWLRAAPSLQGSVGYTPLFLVLAK